MASFNLFMHKQNEHWITAEPFCWKRASSAIVAINENEIVIAPQKLANEMLYIYKYNVITDKWKKWIKYPTKWKIYKPNIAINRDKTKLYIYCTRDQNLIEVNINSEEIKLIYGSSHWDSYTTKEHIQSICVNDIFYAIHYLTSNLRSLNYTNKCFTNVPCKWSNKPQNFDICNPIVYHKHSNSLLILGGFSGDNSIKPSCKIFCYSFITQHIHEWSTCLPCELYQMSALITNDQQYLIVFGLVNKKIIG
eukprot:443143_1